jgi:hypothetical protein
MRQVSAALAWTIRTVKKTKLTAELTIKNHCIKGSLAISPICPRAEAAGLGNERSNSPPKRQSVKINGTAIAVRIGRIFGVAFRRNRMPVAVLRFKSVSSARFLCELSLAAQICFYWLFVKIWGS